MSKHDSFYLGHLPDVRFELTAPHHAAGLYHAVNRDRIHLSRFLPWTAHMQSVADFSGYIDRCIQTRDDGGEYSFVILENDQVVGRIGLHNFDHQNHYAEIGYWLIRASEGKGIITGGCKLLLDHGFNKLHLQRIAIKAAISNTRSRAIPERLGFQFEGVLRQAELVHGTYLDLSLYAMLRADWQQQYRLSKDSAHT